MAAVPMSFRCTLYDLMSKSSREVFLEGDAYITGLGVGGGPIYPPSQPPGGGDGKPPGIWGPTDPRPMPPIYMPPIQPPLPPDFVPPAPGEPPKPLPPPAGAAGWPVQPIAIPDYQVFNYPGYGPIVVAPPAPASP